MAEAASREIEGEIVDLSEGEKTIDSRGHEVRLAGRPLNEKMAAKSEKV